MKRICQICCIVALISCYCNAQSEAGAIWLLIPPSPSMNGMGEIGVCLPDTDPISAYYNPANGLLSYQGISVVSSNMEANWLQNLASDIQLKQSYIGFNLIPNKYPFQFVINKQNTILDLGEQTRIDEYGNYIGKFNSRMSSTAYSIASRFYGDLWIIPVDISLGFLQKKVIQNLVPDEYLDSGSGTSKNVFYDYGILTSLPVKLNIKDKWNFSLSPAFGYSISNIGDSIVFIDPAKADPPPRTVRTGISISAKISLNDEWNLFEYRGARAAYDILVKPGKPIRYQSGFGDIDFFKNVLLSKKDSMLTISRGHEVSFFDIYTFRFGKTIDVSGKINEYTTGYGINSVGIFNFLNHLTEIKNLSEINRYLTIEYNYSKWTEDYGHPRDDTEFSAYTFSFNNIDRIVMWIINQNKLTISKYNNTGLTVLAGMNFSTMIFNNKDTRKTANVKFGNGYDFGIETKIKSLLMGISFTQYTAQYKLEIPVEYFYFNPKITDTYNYLSVYGLIPVSVMGPLSFFGGVQIANCISRNLTVYKTTDCMNCIDNSLNYGVLTGFDILFESRIGIRASYNYWLRNIKNSLFENDKLKLNGIRINLLLNL
ncbi:hypothetical protein KJ762_15615 [bacterium]|nr:hypothetical protein [bacterium]